jgi:multicomponent Na+:H+ antiporter subunit G
MAQVLDIVSWLLLSAGAFFFVVGGVGLVRMPDVYTRMHAVSVSDTLGAGLILGGLIMQAGLTLVTVKLFILGSLFFLTGPVATHALAQAALHAGIRPKLSDDGDLADVMPLAVASATDRDDGRVPGRPS